MRNYLSPEKQSRIVSMLTDEGMPVRRIIEAIGCNPANARTTVVNLAAQGRIFTVRTSTDEAPRSEVWCFPTPEARDRFKESRALASRERIREHHREQAAKRKAERHACGRTRSARSLAAEEREAKKAQERALRAAEAELAKQRARLDREAAAAQKQREKAEAKSQQKRLKAETKAAGAAIFKAGTSSPAPKRPQGPAHLAGEIDTSNARIIVCPPLPSRWDTSKAESIFSDPERVLPPSGWAAAVVAGRV